MTEPAPDIVEQGPGDGPGPRRWRGAVLLVPLAIVALIVLLERSPSHQAAPVPAATTSAAVPSVTAAAPTPTHTLQFVPNGMDPAIAEVPGTPAALALTRRGLYVVQIDPPQVVLVDPASGRVLAAGPAPRNAQGIAVDARHRQAWVWTGNGSRFLVSELDAQTLAPLADLDAGRQIYGGTAYDGQLWLATESGLERIAPLARQPVLVPAAGHDVFAVAADPDRDRLLVASTDGRVRAYDPASRRVVAEARTGLGKPSLAVVGNDLWVGGFGDPRPVHLDARTLEPRRPSPVGDLVGAGAIVSAGQQVVWVRDGGGSDQLFCMNAVTGAVGQRWARVAGTVSSVTGDAFAIHGAAVHRLHLARSCPG